MRWDGLFADLEAQMGGEVEAEERAIRADEVRLDKGRHTLAARIADLGRRDDVVLRLFGGAVLAVRVEQVGSEWVAGRPTNGSRRVLIPTSAVVTARSSSSTMSASAADHSIEVTGLELRVVLRDLARRRTAVSIDTSAGPLHGTIDGVAGDHLELAIHAPGTARRSREVTATESIALAAITTVGY